jgi:hypothetical protein
MASVAYYLWIRARERERRRRVSSRPVVEIQEWYAAHFATKGYERDKVITIVELLANEIGIAPTQLRPSDRLDKDFMTIPTWALADSPLEGFYENLKIVVHGWYGYSWRPRGDEVTVGDLIASVLSTKDDCASGHL